MIADGRDGEWGGKVTSEPNMAVVLLNSQQLLLYAQDLHKTKPINTFSWEWAQGLGVGYETLPLVEDLYTDNGSWRMERRFCQCCRHWLDAHIAFKTNQQKQNSHPCFCKQP